MVPQIVFTRQIELGKAAFTQQAMGQIMAALVLMSINDGDLFNHMDAPASDDYSDPTPTTDDKHTLQRIASISITAAEALVKAYGPIGFAEPRIQESI